MSAPDLRNPRLSALAALLLSGAAAAQNSSVITLTLPVGGRQLGMGETAVAMPDDVFATYWNPAGLAFGPLADEWVPILSNQDLRAARPTVLVPLKRTSLLAPGDVWLGTSRGLQRFDGRAWRKGQSIGLEQGDVVSDITRRWLGNLWPQDTAGQKELLSRVRAANEIERAGEEDDLVDLFLPYDLALSDSVASIAVDETGTAWIGTARGLFSYNGKTWRRIDSSAMPAAEVSALASGGATTIWVGTRNGLARLRRGELRRFGEKLGLASQSITSLLAVDRGRTVWVGTDSGLSRLTIATEAGKEKVSWKQFSRADGLVSDTVVSLTVDPSGGIWVGHPGGVSHFDGKIWERLVFKDISIRAVSSDKKGNIWIASDKGAWKYFPEQAAKRLTGGKGAGAKVPWAQYHAGNGLGANSALAVGSQGDDMWFATDSGIVQLRKASLEVGFMYETLLPSLGLKDLFHTFAGVTVPVEEWGTFGGFINFTSFGENVTYNESQEIDQTFNSYEAIGALSYGLRLTRNSGLGLNLKLIYSALAPGITQDGQTEDGVAASYAFDVAYLRKDLLLRGLSFGAHLQNIGPAVFYIDRDQTDPIPLTWKFGLAYEALRTPSNVLRVAADYSRETVSRYPGSGKARNFASGAYYGVAEPWGEGNAPPNSGWADIARKNLEESIYNLGAEYVYSGVLALRTGLLFDPGGRRQEWDLGAGVTVSDMVQVDGAIIKTIDLIGTTDNSIRNQQLRFSLTLML